MTRSRKKGGTYTCPSIEYERLKRAYSQKGWDGLVHFYKICKEKVVRCRHMCTPQNSGQTKRALVKLGKMRKGIVRSLYEQAVHVLTECDLKVRANYTQFGNTSITSDYDVTILGPLAPEICVHMLLSYFKQCTFPLDTALDTNLYTIGYFLKGAYSPALRHNVLFVPSASSAPESIMLLQPRDVAQGQRVIVHACMKLLYSVRENNSHASHTPDSPKCLIPITTDGVADIIERARLFYQESTSVYAGAIQPIVCEVSRRASNRQKISRHCLQYYFATRLFDLVYAGEDAASRTQFASWQALDHADPNKKTVITIMKRITDVLDATVARQRKRGIAMDWVDLAAMGSFFQTDAYYTLCSVNTVVLEIQRVGRGQIPSVQGRRHYFRRADGARAALTPVNYICAAIECCGDVLRSYEHFRLADIPANLFAPKLEKYLLRIEYCLSILARYLPEELVHLGSVLKEYHATLRQNNKVHSFVLVFKLFVATILNVFVANLHRRELYTYNINKVRKLYKLYNTCGRRSASATRRRRTSFRRRKQTLHKK